MHLRLCMDCMTDCNITLFDLVWQRSDDGMTPVHVAATWGYSQALHLLLSHGGNPELLDEDGSNALDMAVENGNWECLGLLTTYLHQKEKGTV